MTTIWSLPDEEAIQSDDYCNLQTIFSELRDVASSLESLTIDCRKEAIEQAADGWMNPTTLFDPPEEVAYLQEYTSLKEMHVMERFLFPVQYALCIRFESDPEEL